MYRAEMLLASNSNFFNGDSISKWLQNNVLIVVVIIVGIGIIIKANTGETRKAVTTAGIVLLGMLIVGLAPHTKEMGEFLYGLVGGNE